MRKFFALLTMIAVTLGAASAFAADKPKGDKKADPEAAFKKLDKDSNGSLTEAEFLGKREGDAAAKGKELFARLDKDKDGKVTLEEFKTRGKKAK